MKMYVLRTSWNLLSLATENKERVKAGRGLIVAAGHIKPESWFVGSPDEYPNSEAFVEVVQDRGGDGWRLKEELPPEVNEWGEVCP